MSVCNVADFGERSVEESVVLQMIIRAIEALNDENGANKSTISKYIESTYGDLPAGHSALLSHHLNRMKDSGELVFWKNNYTKADPNAPPRRGRGRPPKDPNAPPKPPGSSLGSGRPRGRPPKDPNAPPKPPKMKMSLGSGKPRGRPRKMAKPTGGFGGGPGASSMSEASTGKPRGRGRPPKVNNPFAEVSYEH